MENTIQVKYSIGQKVWSIQDNKIQELEVSSVVYKEYYRSDEKDIYVDLRYGLGFNYVDDYKDITYRDVLSYDIFSTKEELLNHYK